MAGFVEGLDRSQSTMLPASLDDYVGEDNPVRVVDAFVDGLDLRKLGFTSIDPLDTGRPGYHPATMLKLYIYGYLNRIPSSRRLERECQRNLELIWLTGKLAPDFKTIADFRKDFGEPIRKTCREFVVICRKLDLLAKASVAIERASGSVSEICLSSLACNCSLIALRRTISSFSLPTFSFRRVTFAAGTSAPPAVWRSAVSSCDI